MYRRIGLARHAHFPFASDDGRHFPPPRRTPARDYSAGDIARRFLLERFAPAAVLVNERCQAQYFHGPTDRYLIQPGGEPTRDVIAMARKGLGGKLRAAIYKAIKDGDVVRIDGLRIVGQDRMRRVALTVAPVEGRSERVYLVTFEEQREIVAESEPVEGLSEEAVARQLEHELHATREDLQSTIEEMETSNEELKAANEEVMSMNEELQSANEELETSKEELQSLNEELTALNVELQEKVEEVEASSNDFSNLLNSSDVATIFLDMNLRIKRFTPNATRLLNLIPSDLRRPFTDITHNLDDPTLHADSAAVAETLTVREREVPAKDGRWFLRRILPYRTHDNRIEGVVITFFEITIIKKAERILNELNQTLEKRVAERTRELASSEARWRTFMEATVTGTMSIDVQGVVVDADRIYAALAGRDGPEQVIGRSVAEWTAPHHQEVWRRAFEGGLEAQAPEQFEVDYVRPDGSILPVEVTAALVETTEGARLLCLCRDISERRRSAQRIHDQAEFLEDILESISHPLYVVNAHDYSIAMANSAARRLQKDGRGRCHAFIHGGDRPCSEPDKPCPLEIARQTLKPATVEHVVRDDQGAVSWLEIQGFPIVRDGKVVQLIEYAFDITARKRSEEEVTRAREAAEYANKAKSNFLAAMSHDLRTPLNGILGYSEAILSGSVGATFDDRARDYLSTIHAAGEHLLSLIDDILDLSALDTEKLELREDLTRPAAIAEGCLRLVSGLAQQNDIDLKIAVPKRLPGFRADERRVTQILVNLLGNAIKFSPGGSMVTLSIDVDQEGCLVFTVTDQGPGMETGQIGIALEPFGQIDNMTNRTKKGAGLGLPIARGLAQAHGGSLSIKSSPGKGTTVTVRFPASRTVEAGRK